MRLCKDAFLFHHPLQPFGKNYYKQDGSTNDQDQFIVNKRPRSFQNELRGGTSTTSGVLIRNLSTQNH